MSQVFVSYTEADLPIAVEVVRCLDEAGFSTWHFKRDCEEGRWYGDQITDAIRVAEAVVVVLTRATMASDPVHREVALGTKLRKKFLPVVVGMREDQVEDNDFLYALSRSTWVVVPDGRLTEEVGRVVRGIRQWDCARPRRTRPRLMVLRSRP